MNLDYLKDRISDSKIPITALAEKLGVSRQTLYTKLRGERDFKTSEITKMCEILRLTDEEKRLVFFADIVDKIDN